MASLTGPRITKQAGVAFGGGGIPGTFNGDLGIADNVVIYAGALVVQDTSGYLRPGRISTTDVAVGCAAPFGDRYDNTVTGHVAGGGTLFPNGFNIQIGTFYWDNDAANPILSTTQRGTAVYVLDDHTVSLSSNGSTRIKAGLLWQLDPQTLQVIVAMSPVTGM